MSIYVSDLREQVIKPCLEVLGDFSETGADLLMGTAAQESIAGPGFCPDRQGLGIYRITIQKHYEVWDKYLIQFPDLASLVRGLASQQQFLKNPHNELVGNLSYATAIAWMIYKSKLIDVQKPTDLNNLAQLWALQFDNGTGCTRRTEDFIDTYRVNLLSSENQKLVA